ncbi:MAG: hypothetical protein II077_11175, partial [Treponema sp.]|nr:hypothetical protein [Treponema sp.]
ICCFHKTRFPEFQKTGDSLTRITGKPGAKVRMHSPRRMASIDRARAVVNPFIPVATANESAQTIAALAALFY